MLGLLLKVVGLTLLNATVNDCAKGQSIFLLNAVDITPTNPVPGEKVSLHIDYTVPDGLVVTGGTSEYSTTYNFIPFAPTVEPLCQDIPCPLGAGRYSNISVSDWPTGLSGQLDTKMKWFDDNKNLLLCMGMHAKF